MLAYSLAYNFSGIRGRTIKSFPFHRLLAPIIGTFDTEAFVTARGATCLFFRVIPTHIFCKKVKWLKSNAD
jgi:hypothetical protein